VAYVGNVRILGGLDIHYFYLVDFDEIRYTSPPALSDMGCRSRMICARCDTPVPQPLSVVNSVKAYNFATVRR